MEDLLVSGKIPGTNFVITYNGMVVAFSIMLATMIYIHLYYNLSQPWPRPRRYAGKIIRPAKRPNYLQYLRLQTNVTVLILKNV